MYTRVMHYQGAYVHKIGFFLGFWLRRDSFLEPLKDKEDYKGNEHHRNDRGECFCNDVEKYAITTNNVSLTPSSHLIFASFFNIWFMSLVILEKLGMNLLKTLAFPKKDCKDFLCVGREIVFKGSILSISSPPMLIQYDPWVFPTPSQRRTYWD